MGNRDKRVVIKQFYSRVMPYILCLQESKIQIMSDG